MAAPNQISVHTPAGYVVQVSFIEKEEAKQIVAGRDVQKISSEGFDHKRMPAYQLSGGRIFHQTFFGGEGYLYSSKSDLEKCNDLSKYKKFMLRYFGENDYYYYFELNPNYIKEKLSNGDYKENSRYSDDSYQAISLSDGAYLYLSKPHLNSGKWLPTIDLFKSYYAEFSGGGKEKEQVKAETKTVIASTKITKQLLLGDGSRATVVKVDAEAAFSYLNNTKSKIENFTSNTHLANFFKPYLLQTGEVIMLWDQEIFLLFKDQKLFEEFIAREENDLIDEYFQDLDNSRAFESLIHQSPTLLSSSLQIDIRKLDYSSTSVLTLEEAVNKCFASNFFAYKVIPLLAAYLSEVIRREVNGKLIIEQDEYGYWQPVVNSHGGGNTYFLGKLMEEITEQEYNDNSCISCIYPSQLLLPRR